MRRKELDILCTHLYTACYDFYFDCFYNHLDGDESPFSFSYDAVKALAKDLLSKGDIDFTEVFSDIDNKAKHDAKEAEKEYNQYCFKWR